MKIEPEVTIVLSDEFSSRLAALARSCHVWVVRTPANERVAQEIWKEHPPGSQSVTNGITVFTGTGHAEEDLLSILDTIELHHGIAAEQATANAISVLGVEPTDAIREALGSLGFNDIAATSDGFIARWCMAG